MSQVQNLGAANGGGGTNIFQTDSGIAVPAAGVITFNAVSQAGATIVFSGAGSTVRLNTTDSNHNTFLGQIAGNLTLTGNQNSGFGYQSCHSITSGSGNTGCGFDSLADTTSGGDNTGMGHQALGTNSTGNSNTACGENALSSLMSGSFNSALGSRALLTSTADSNNVAIGYEAIWRVIGGNNTVVGTSAATNIAGAGTGNIIIGYTAGSSYTTTESNNIIIGSPGVIADSGVIRIGTSATHTSAFMQGISGVAVSNQQAVVINSSTGQLGTSNGSIIKWTVITGASQTIAVNNGYIANNAGTISFALPATSAVGDVFEITSINNATGWTVTQALGQQIRFGSSQTTSGAGGSLSASANGDSIRAVCTVANTNWNILSSIGNITIV